jgi:HAMP domain-containing protein
MIVICEECGKKYDIDQSRIRGPQARAKCKACGRIITITRRQNNPPAPSPPPRAREASPGGWGREDATPVMEVELEQKLDASEVKPVKSEKRRYRFGLRSRIFLLFFFIPIALFVSSTYWFYGEVNTLSTAMMGESENVVTRMAEAQIRAKGEAVAQEVGLYLKTHPNLRKEDFHKDPEFMKVAVQKVGKTGYTVVNAAPTQTEPWRIWAHPKEALIGADILGATKARLSPEDFIRFKRMHDGAVANKKESRGYYRFLDDKEKYASFTAVEGTNYWILSTTYIDEFTLPMQNLQERMKASTADTLRIIVFNVALTILLVALIAFFYGLRLSGNIRSLTQIADRISVGDMDVEFDVKSKDELGDLAEAIARMQDSIRLSIERLRRRR